jgi:hypothetical protein
MLTQSDKGRTTVIIYKRDYDEKVHTFLTENDIQPIPKKSNEQRLQNSTGDTSHKRSHFHQKPN